MKNKLIKLALVGKTNAGKSTLINLLVGEHISIINKKINTTQDLIIGIKNVKNTQLIFYDTPGSNFLKINNILQKQLKTNIWQAIDSVDILIYIIDVYKFNFKEVKNDIEKISEVKKDIFCIFNKIDLIENKKILKYIEDLKIYDCIKEFFPISAKFNLGIDNFVNSIISRSKVDNWLFKKDEITDKDDIYITKECTRNAILEFLHQEIPYNIKIINNVYMFLKNGDLKIKQSIEINNIRYKPILLGKKGQTIKRIREKSQMDIKKIFNCNIHLYINVIIKNVNQK